MGIQPASARSAGASSDDDSVWMPAQRADVHHSPSCDHHDGLPRLRSAARSCSVIVSNTGCTSARRLLITCSTSAVAVCRSSASLVSLNSRAFWIAITAWSAKVCSSAISLAANGPVRTRPRRWRRCRAVPQHRREGHRCVAGESGHLAQHPRHVLAADEIRPVNDAPRGDRASGRRALDRRREGRGDRVVGVADVGGDLQLPLLVDQQHVHLVAAEEAMAAFEDLLEHRLRVGDRTADDAQDLGGGLSAAPAPRASR